MPSPIFDSLHLKLSRKIQDPVGTASTDGDITSALRTDWLNKANRFIQLSFFPQNLEGAQTYLSGLVATASITMSSGTLPSDFSYAIAFEKDAQDLGDYMFVLPDRKPQLDAGIFPEANRVFTIFSNRLYAYKAGIIVSSGTGTLYYVKSDQRAQANDTNDIGINSIWHDTLVDVAATYYFEEKEKMPFAEAEAKRKALVERK